MIRSGSLFGLDGLNIMFKHKSNNLFNFLNTAFFQDEKKPPEGGLFVGGLRHSVGHQDVRLNFRSNPGCKLLSALAGTNDEYKNQDRCHDCQNGNTNRRTKN